MADDLRRIIDNSNLSNEEIAKRVSENLNKNSEQVVEDKSKEEPISELEKALSPEELNYLISVLDVRQGDVQTNNIIKKLQDKGVNFTMDELVSLLDKKKEERMSNKEEFFNELEKRISKEDMEYLLSVDLDNPGSKISYIAARAGVTNYEVIELAKYRKAQMKEYERLSIYDKALNEQDLKYLMKAKDVKQADYEINNILIRLRKQGIDANLKDLASFIEYKKGGIDFSKFDSNKEQNEKENADVATKNENVAVSNDSSNVNIADRLKQINELFKTGKPISGELIDERNKLIEKRDKMYEEYISVVSRLQEIEKKISIAIKNDEIIPNELNNERTKLIERKNELLPQIEELLNVRETNEKPRNLSDYVEEQKQEKDNVDQENDEEVVDDRSEQETDADVIVDERLGTKVWAKLKSIWKKPWGKFVTFTGIAAIAGTVAVLIHSVKHGDTQSMSDALHQLGLHVQDTANQADLSNIDYNQIDTSNFGQHITDTYSSTYDVPSGNGLSIDQENFGYDAYGYTDLNHIKHDTNDLNEIQEAINNHEAEAVYSGHGGDISGYISTDDWNRAMEEELKSAGRSR